MLFSEVKMKKFLSIIIILASLLLVSCAGIEPAESTEISWKTSIISTTASTQIGTTATATAGTAATAGTSATTAAPITTTATETTKSEPVTPQTPFVPSGYRPQNYSSFETRSKVMLMDYKGGGETTQINATYYYSKADGEFYPFCFDPFCDHNLHVNDDSLKCVGRIFQFEIVGYPLGAWVFYLNSRIYFAHYGSIYSCSEFATDVRLEIEFEKINSNKEFDIVKKRGGQSFIFKNMFGYGESLFFDYIDPEGNVIWYRYNVVTKKLDNYSDKLEKLGEKIGVKLVVGKIGQGYIAYYAYTNIRKNAQGKEESDFVGGYITDFNLENLIKTEETQEISYHSCMVTDVGIIRWAFNYKNNKSNFDLVYLYYDGTVEVLVKDVVNTFGKSNVRIDYFDGRYFYFLNNKSKIIGYEYNWHGYVDLSAFFDGNVYRYDTKTKKVDVVFKFDTPFSVDGVDVIHDVRIVDYYNVEEHIAIFLSQSYIDTGERHNGKPVYEQEQYLLKCHLDENGVVDSFEIVEFE